MGLLIISLYGIGIFLAYNDWILLGRSVSVAALGIVKRFDFCPLFRSFFLIVNDVMSGA